MRPVVRVVMIAALLMGIGSSGQDRNPRGDPEGPTAITLSNVHPTGEFPVDPQTVAAAPAVLALKVTNVVNPAGTAFQLFVSLTYQPAVSPSATKKIPVGNVGFYPPDRPAGFLLRSSRAFGELKHSGARPDNVRLSLEIKRLHESKPWTPVEITVAPPEWKSESEN